MPRSFALAVSAVALAGLVVGPAGQGQAREVIGLEGKRSPVFLEAAVDVRRSATGRIAFSAGAYPHEDVYVVKADGSGLGRLTDDPGADFDPSWSPDGRRIAYRHEGPGGDSTAEIDVMNADGSQKRNLTRRPAQDHSPAWSPDGRRIAFASVRSRPMPSIWVMNADGSKQRRLSRVSGEHPAPTSRARGGLQTGRRSRTARAEARRRTHAHLARKRRRLRVSRSGRTAIGSRRAGR